VHRCIGAHITDAADVQMCRCAEQLQRCRDDGAEWLPSFSNGDCAGVAVPV
jgi:hypothetical protein